MANLQLLNYLIDAASKIAGNDTRLAELLNRPKQHISNWRHGTKKPSVEVQADLAIIAGLNAPMVILGAMIEEAEGARKERLQAELRRWGRNQEKAAAQPLTPAIKEALEEACGLTRI